MVGLFACVYAEVALQRLQVTEAGSTDLAWVWLLARVDQHMSAQMSNLEEKRKKKKVGVKLKLNFSDITCFISARLRALLSS